MLLALILLGAPPMEIYLKADVGPAAGKAVAIYGTARRTAEGTAVVLDDGTQIAITRDEPPIEWLALIGKFVRVAGTLDGSRLTGFSPPTPATRNLAKLHGKHVELSGVAHDAKGGAILLVDNEPLYLRKLTAWPEALRGKPLVVKGTLKSMKLLPSPERGPKGEISQGAEGSQWVLEDASF